MSESQNLGVLAHELAAPVAAISSLAELAVQTEGAVDWPRFVGLVVTATRDIERILADPELRSLVEDDVDIGRLLHAIAVQGGERVSVEATPATIVRGDGTRLRQALANLVRNGLRHGEHVTLTAERRGDLVVIDVVDDGPGVDPGVDVFSRGVSAAGSTGYGLWIAQGIATAHGGTLEVVPGSGGARFRLALPSSGGAS